MGVCSVYTGHLPRGFPVLREGPRAAAGGGGVSSHPRSRYSQIREHRVTLHLGCEVAELALRPCDRPSQVNK